jgi:iron complex outermembrane receptor protein
MKQLFVMLLGLVWSLAASADPSPATASLSGHITDAIDGDSLAGVIVTIPELQLSTSTGPDGRYQFTSLPMRTVTVQVSYLGHQPQARQVDLSRETTVDFVLVEQSAQLGEVVVTAPTGKSLLRDAPAPITLVSADQLRATPATNVIDALSHEPGVAQVTTGGGISKPVIRGLGFNRLLVVNDGIRQEGNQWGDEHGVEIDAQSVSSAEIIKGPASLMYGSDALAGVIVFHGDPVMERGTMGAEVSTEYQSNTGLVDYSVNFRGNQGGFVWNGRWTDKWAHDYHNPADGYVVGSRFRERDASLLTGYNGGWGYSHLTLCLYHLTPGIAEGDRADRSLSYNRTLPFQQVHHYKVVSDNDFLIGRSTLHATVGYQQNRRQEYEESADETGLDLQLHTVNYDVRLQLPHQDGWKTTVGAGGMWQHNLNRGSEYLIPDYQLFDIGAFATSTLRLGSWSLAGGLRVDRRHLHAFGLDDLFDRFSRNFTSVSGSVGAVYNMSHQMQLRANLAKGFRAPGVSELSANGVHEGTQQYMVGNTDLDAEQSWQFDLGWSYTSRWVTSQLSLFANRISHYIYAARQEGQEREGVPVYQYTQGDARLLGGEAVVDIHPVDRLHWQNSFSYVNSVQLHQPHSSRYLPFTPAPRWNCDLRYTLVRDGRVVDHAYVSANMECDLRQNHYYAEGGTETATPGYALFGLQGGMDLKLQGRRVATLSLSATNLFNRAYQSHLSRLKYVGGINPDNGREGLFDMGRNITAKLIVYIL